MGLRNDKVATERSHRMYEKRTKESRFGAIMLRRVFNLILEIQKKKKFYDVVK